MLVITRKPSQRIVIGGNIVIDLIQVQGNRVRVGISAPAEITIMREELLEKAGGQGSALRPSADAVVPWVGTASAGAA